MRTLLSYVIAMALLSLFPVAIQAKQLDMGVGVYIDQDMLVPLYNEDRDYTMGLAIEFFWSKERGLYPLDNLVRKAGRWLGMEEAGNDIVYSFMLGTVTYTPDDLADPAPITTDRPYSSLIYLSNKRVRADYRRAVAAEVLLGVLGTSLAKNTQIQLHEMYREASGSDEPVEPRGWSHQISDGGELAVRLRLSNSLFLPELSKIGLWDVALMSGLSLGYQTNINVGAAIRAGHMKSAFWSLPYDPVNRGNFLPSAARNEWYFWSAVRVHFVAYDALLQGQFRDSDVTYNSDQIERVVYDGAFGLTAGFKGAQFTLSGNSRSPELKNTTRRQIWGSINFLFHF